MSKSKSAAVIFRSRLAEARDQAGLSQVALAVAAGTTERTIRNYENGTQTPSLAVLDSLAEALKIPPAKLIS